MEPARIQWQVRCAFNGFCKRVLKNEAINAYNQRRQRQSREMTFSDRTDPLILDKNSRELSFS